MLGSASVISSIAHEMHGMHWTDDFTSITLATCRTRANLATQLHDKIKTLYNG
jgi:hypothetical protein